LFGRHGIFCLADPASKNYSAVPPARLELATPALGANLFPPPQLTFAPALIARDAAVSLKSCAVTRGKIGVPVNSIQVRKVSGSNQIRYGPLVRTVYGLVRCLAFIDDVLDSTAGYTEAG